MQQEIYILPINKQWLYTKNIPLVTKKLCPKCNANLSVSCLTCSGHGYLIIDRTSHVHS